MMLVAKYSDNGEREAFDRFLIDNYQVKSAELYKSGDQFYIFCSGVDDAELSRLNKYVADHRQIGSWVLVVKTLPPNATRVPSRTNTEVIELTGAFKSQYIFLSDLHLELNRILKSYKVVLQNPNVLIYHVDSITEEMKNILQKMVDRLGISFYYKFEKVEQLESITEQHFDDTNLVGDILVSRFSAKGYSSRVRVRLEEDEEFWVDNRIKVFTNPKLKKDELLPREWSFDCSKCLIDVNTGSKEQNILNLLSIYEKIIFTLPFDDNFQQFLKALNVTKADLVTLVQKGRIQFIAPNNINSYPKSLLEELSEIGNSSILFTRRLASATINDLRRRNPLLFPTMSIKERQEVLLAFNSLRNELTKSQKDRNFLVPIIDQINSLWYSYPEVIHWKGALGTRLFGTSRLIKDSLKLTDNQFLAMEVANQMVGWGGALDSHLIPYPFGGIDVEPFYNASALLNSGVPNRDWIPKNFEYANLAIEKLLVVNNEIPPVEFASIFKSADVNRFRKQILDIAKHKRNVDELNDAIKLFNSYVIQIDKSKNREWDISGFLIDGTAELAGIPFFSWITGRFIDLFQLHKINNEGLSSFLDGIVTDTLPSAVLVSRMRNQLVESWKRSRYDI